MSKIKDILEREARSADELFCGIADYLIESKKNAGSADQKTWLDEFIDQHKTPGTTEPEERMAKIAENIKNGVTDMRRKIDKQK